MAKALFYVRKYPARHPQEEELVPVGALIDLSHLTIHERILLVEMGKMEPKDGTSLKVPAPVVKEPPKLNKYGLPFGQVPEKKALAKDKPPNKE